MSTMKDVETAIQALPEEDLRALLRSNGSSLVGIVNKALKAKEERAALRREVEIHRRDLAYFTALAASTEAELKGATGARKVSLEEQLTMARQRVVDEVEGEKAPAAALAG